MIEPGGKKSSSQPVNLNETLQVILNRNYVEFKGTQHRNTIILRATMTFIFKKLQSTKLIKVKS